MLSFLVLLSGCDEEAALLKCFRQRRDEKKGRKKKSFYTAYPNDIIFFSSKVDCG